MKFLALAISSLGCLLSGASIIQVNKKIESNFKVLKEDQFLKGKDGASSRNQDFSPWSLIYASGSLSYLRQLIDQIQLEPNSVKVESSEDGAMTSSSNMYIPRLKNLLQSFLEKKLDWESLVEPTDTKPLTEEKKVQSLNFPAFKAKFFTLNSWVEVGIFTLIIQMVFVLSLVTSITFVLLDKKLVRREKVKWITYYLFTNVLGWIYIKFLKNKLFGKKLSEEEKWEKRYLEEIEEDVLNLSSGINISNLNFSLDNSQILKDINLRLTSNEFYTIMGPNGSGKTTLLKNIVGILSKTRGEIEIGGKNITSISEKRLWKKIVYIPQEWNIQPDTPVYDFLLYSRFIFLKRTQRATPLDHLKVLKAIKKCGLEEFRYSRMGELSGGQRQKVILASILVKDAEIILLDEPSTHLDIENKNFLISLLEELKKSRKIVIANLHNFAEIAKLSSKIIAIKNGIVQKFSSVEEVLQSEFLNKLYDLKLPEEKWKRIVSANPIGY